jgi:hypothetical protein
MSVSPYAGAVVVVLAGGLVPLDLHVVLSDTFHSVGDGVVDADLRCDDRLGVLVRNGLQAGRSSAPWRPCCCR